MTGTLNWNTQLEQSLQCPEFVEQVNWELDHIEKADKIIFYLAPDTSAPITLLELGGCSMAFPKKCIVVCPKPFWRKGNVDVICERYGITQVSTLEEAVQKLNK